MLEAVKRWLEPLPDKSLPSVGIQKAIFEVLPKVGTVLSIISKEADD